MMRSRVPKRKRDPVPAKYGPSALEVIQTLLDPKVRGEAVAGEGEVIVEHDIYATSPESLNWNPVPRLQDNERYYFVKRKPLSRDLEEAKNVERRVETGDGYWKKSKKIRIKEGAATIACYDLMNFYKYEGNGKPKTAKNSFKTDFLMHEFYLADSTVTDWVVCLVKYKVRRNAVQQQAIIPLPVPEVIVQPPAIIPLPPPEVIVQPAAIIPVPPPEADPQPGFQFLTPEEIYALMMEDDGTYNYSHNDLQWMNLTPPPEEATLIMEDSTATTTMEVDEGQPKEEATTVVSQQQHEDDIDDGWLVDALEHQEEEDDIDDGWLVDALEHQEEEDDIDDGWLVDALELPDSVPPSQPQPEYDESIAMDKEEHQQKEEEGRVMSGFELFCKEPPPIPRHLVFEKSPVSLRNGWFDMGLNFC